MSKKKIFAIIIFIVFGLFMFSFANPIEVDEGMYGEVEVDKTKLKDAIERGNAIIDAYGTGSDVLKELDEAVKDGQDVYDDESTQKEVDDATKRIEDAIKKVEEDIMNKATIQLFPNTVEPSEFVNLITTVTILDNKYIDNVKFVVGTNCYANGTNLVLDVNNQALTTVNANSTYTSCLFLTNGTVKQASQTIGNIVAKIPDTEAPVISLNGDEEVKIVLGKTTYEDELAKVIDNVDDEREIAGELEGKVDEIGSYVLKYNAKDEAGNEAKEVVRTIKVLDPKGDEDNDGFTNEEEVDAKTDFDDPESHPETDKPTISLLGENPYVMLQNREYEEAGVKITLDSHDNITKLEDVETESDLDVTKVGTYTIKYTITDRYGKSASVERTVKVLDPKGDEDNDGFTNEEEMEKPVSPVDPTSPKSENNPLVDTNPTNPLDELEHPETYAPSISLKGETPIYLEVYDEYIELGVEITLDSHDDITELEDVVVEGEVDTTKLGTYTITYTITDRYGKVASVTREVIVRDTIAPVINLNGNSEMTFERESSYVELGANVTDNYDNDITVVITGEVDTTKLGTYYVKYNAKDSSGNEATEVIRTITIVRSENDKALNRIEATLSKTEYKRLEAIEGLTVTAYDNDGTSYDVTTSSAHDFNSSTVGSKTLKVTYNGKEANLSYTVVRNDFDKKIASITATLNPTTYDRGTANYGTLTVTATDNDSTTHELSASEYIVTGWDSSLEVGSESVTRNLTITLKNNNTIKTTVAYTIVRSENDKTIKELIAVLEKDVYKRGETMSNIIVTRVDNDGTRTILNSTQYTLEGFSTATVGGPYTLTVKHDGMSATDTYTVGDIEVNINTPELSVSGKKAEPGETVSYEISLSTDMQEVNFPTYTIEIADGMTLTSCPENATCEGNKITWTPTSITDKLNYSATVANNIAAGSVIKTTVKENGEVVKEFDTQVEVTVEVSTTQTKPTSLDVVLTLDVSGSMWECSTYSDEKCTETKIESLINVTNNFITELNTKNTNGSTINLTIITFGRLRDTDTCKSGFLGLFSDYSGCYETLYSGSLTSSTLNTIKSTVSAIDDNGKNSGGTPLYGALNSALSIINNSKLENKYLVVLGDGEPTDSDSYNVINNLNKSKANIFSIGFKVDANSNAEKVLKNVVNNNNEHYFSATNSESLKESFSTIQNSISTNPLQTVNGRIDAVATNAKSIEISHSGMAKVKITDLSATSLINYNISIVDGKYVWDVSKYPGYTDFKMIVNY